MVIVMENISTKRYVHSLYPPVLTTTFLSFVMISYIKYQVAIESESDEDENDDLETILKTNRRPDTVAKKGNRKYILYITVYVIHILVIDI